MFQNGYGTGGGHPMVGVAVGARIGLHWGDFQPTADSFNYSAFDVQARPIIATGKVIVINLGTGNVEGETPAAPKWLFTSGVPKVTTTGGNCPKKTTCTWPYYLDATYTKLFHAAHAELRKHLNTAYTADEQKLIVGIKPVFGSTGDVTPWHGTPTDKKYEISDDAWNKYCGDESTYVASLYADWANDAGRDFYLIMSDLPLYQSQIAKVIPSYHFATEDNEVCKDYQETSEKTCKSIYNR